MQRQLGNVNQSNEDFLLSAYEIILGRTPDSSGLMSYLNNLNQGTPRFRVILDLITSPEAKFRGFDSTEVEDIISFYLREKNNLWHMNLDRKIANKYSDRLFDFFYKLRYRRDVNCFKSVEPIGLIKSVEHSSQSIENGYLATRRRAEVILEKLYKSRQLNPKGSPIDDSLGIHVPRWVGVTNSTKFFFPHTFSIPLLSDDAPENLSDDQIRAFIDVLIESEFSQLVFSGGDHVQYRIAKAVKERAPRKRIKVIWHGSPRQLGPHYELDPFMAWVGAARNGICEAIGTVKPGMTRLFDALKIRAHYLQNSVNVNPSHTGAQIRLDAVGMWLSHVGNYNKPTAPTLLALARSRRLSLQGAGFGEDGIQLIQRLGIPHKSISPSPVPHAIVLEGMRTSKLTVYITLSECMPMVPFESIGAGTPCLVGPSTRIYDDPLLEDHLVVRNPFDPVEISNKIEQAVENYDELLTASINFLHRSKARSTQNLTEFLA